METKNQNQPIRAKIVAELKDILEPLITDTDLVGLDNHRLHLISDIGLDSIGILQVILEIEKTFGNMLLAMLALFFVFAFRYTVPDRYAFFIPFYCLAALLIAVGAKDFIRKFPMFRPGKQFLMFLNINNFYFYLLFADWRLNKNY